MRIMSYLNVFRKGFKRGYMRQVEKRGGFKENFWKSYNKHRYK